MLDERIKSPLRRFWPVAAMLALYMVQPCSWREAALDRSSDLFFRIRGARTCDERFLLVYVGSEDIKALGGWPITRDYYGYFMHIMQEKQALVIAPDLLFSEQDKQYHEYDDILAHYMHLGRPVVLPMVFNRFDRPAIATAHSYQADLPVWPYAPFRNSAKGIGFSNLVENSVVYRLPVTTQYRDTTMLSFGAEIARTWFGGRPCRQKGQQLLIPDQHNQSRAVFLNQYGELRLNHFDHNIPSISLVELLHTYNRTPDSLRLNDKLVLLAVTAPGQVQLKSTPGGATLSASLLQATVAENIINDRYLKPWPWWLTLASLAAMSAFPAILAGSGLRRKWLWISGLPILHFIISYAIFSFFNSLVEWWLPYAGWTMASAWALWRTWAEKQGQAHEQKRLWQEQIALKSKQLQELNEQIAAEAQESKRLSADHARLMQEKAEAVLALEKHIRDLQQADQPAASANAYDLVYSANGKMAQVLSLIEKISHSDINILIMGETGTGKELVARAIHQAGPRRQAPFMAVNCGALSETLLESELFGHEKGSFTGAQARRRGVFELADRGTLFLDEISETSPALQAKLLRVLQEKVLYRVGGEQAIHVDVRVLAASNRDVKELVDRQLFRSDLYYRLNGFSLSLPALRERPEDIHLLADHFLRKHGYKESRFSEQVLELFRHYRWPGNVRELENIVRRSAMLAEAENRRLVQAADLPDEISKPDTTAPTMFRTIDEQILELMRRFHFSRDAISRTARHLGNKDRGTITEYFRGLCFEHLVACNYNLDAAAASLAGGSDESVRRAARGKLAEYINNVNKWSGDESDLQNGTATPLRGLPKKYHQALFQVWRAGKENRIA